MEIFPATNMFGVRMTDDAWTYHVNDGGPLDAVLWPEADGWKAVVNALQDESIDFDLGQQPDERAALAELNRKAFEARLDLSEDGYWLASVTDSHGTRELAREVDYDDALAEISDEIAHRPDVDRRQLDDALERIDRTPDCQTFDDLRVGGRTYMIEEVGPEIDASTEDRELEARFEEAMRQSDRALGYEP
jgi:hypothetical protein